MTGLIQISLSVLLLAASVPAYAQTAQTSELASLRGMVRDLEGKAVPRAEVQLRSKGSKQFLTAQTDARGTYVFPAVHEGVYVLRVVMNGHDPAEVSPLVLASKEAKTVNLMLGAPVSAASSNAPQFFDEPQFTVSGVTDTTNLGGHGSDTVVRTRESLAKQTASLGEPAGNADAANFPATEKSLREILDREPKNFEANHHLGQLLLVNKRADEALPFLKRAAEIQPADPEVHHLLGDAQEKLGDPLEAVRQYQRAAEISPSEPYVFDWGSELLLHHAPEPAVQVFTKGSALYPRSARMLIGLGAAWFARGANEQAAERICQAIDFNPNDVTGYLFLGKMLRAESKPSDDEVERLRRFVTLQPQNPEANYYYAVALWKQQKGTQENVISQTESLLNQTIHLDPKFAAAHLQLGIVHAEQRDYAKAIADYRRAIEMEPQLEEAHYRLGQAYRQVGQADQSKEELRTYEQISRNSAEQVDRERHEIRQFVYTLRDQPASRVP